MTVRMIPVRLNTDSGGNATEKVSNTEGIVHSVRVEVGSLANTSDITLTDDVTGEALLTLTNVAASKTYYPRALAQSLAGADLSGWYSEDGVPTSGKITVTVVQGGASVSGVVRIFLD